MRMVVVVAISIAACCVGRLASADPATRPAAPSAAALDPAALGAWAKVLREHVDGGLIDYQAIRAHCGSELKAYLDAVDATDVAGLPREHRLAIYVNLYNASMIAAVIDRYRTDYSPSEQKGKIFTEPLVRVGGKVITLDDLEHKILRPEFKDPRVHAALVCAGMSCPPLRAEPYRGETIDAQLDDAMRSWLNDPKANRVDAGARKVYLSKIFRWFAEDFGGMEKLDEYVAPFVGVDTRGFEVVILQYDWRLNDASPTGRP